MNTIVMKCCICFLGVRYYYRLEKNVSTL